MMRKREDLPCQWKAEQHEEFKKERGPPFITDEEETSAGKKINQTPQKGKRGERTSGGHKRGSFIDLDTRTSEKWERVLAGKLLRGPISTRGNASADEKSSAGKKNKSCEKRKERLLRMSEQVAKKEVSDQKSACLGGGRGEENHRLPETP